MPPNNTTVRRSQQRWKVDGTLSQTESDWNAPNQIGMHRIRLECTDLLSSGYRSIHGRQPTKASHRSSIRVIAGQRRQPRNKVARGVIGACPSLQPTPPEPPMLALEGLGQGPQVAGGKQPIHRVLQ